MKPISISAYELLHDGALVLADIESAGIRVDVEYLTKLNEQLETTITNIERDLWHTLEAKEWKARFKDRTNFSSPTQLSVMLFKEWGNKPTKATRRGNAAVDDAVLSTIGTPFTRKILELRKMEKVKNTYVVSLLREQVDGMLHPSFNLHLVSTYRSSCDGPNFQNMPVRDPEQGEMVRRAIIPHSPETQIGEIDYKGVEVCSNACYNKDPNLIAYVEDPSKDMHRGMAAECFCLKLEQVGKKIRYVGKNGFTFPAFYGSYFEHIAPAMWKAIDEHNLITEDGIPLKKHLKSKGIGSLAVFQNHIEEVEHNFWDKRFAIYGKWKRDWYESYLSKGWFDLLTGFRCQGPMRKNEVTNYPGQGTAFHFLLWGMIQLHRWLVANEMQTKIIGQIHDNVVFNFCPDEVEAVLHRARKIMCEDIRRHWPWINVPLSIEAELAPPSRSWHEKEKVEIG